MQKKTSKIEDMQPAVEFLTKINDHMLAPGGSEDLEESIRLAETTSAFVINIKELATLIDISAIEKRLKQASETVEKSDER